MERCATGIRELDQLLAGGIPCGHSVLVAGSAGSGKTQLGLQFLAHGAQGGERGLLLAFGEPVASLHAAGRRLGLPEADGADAPIRVEDLARSIGPGGEPAMTIAAMQRAVRDHKATRVVVDTVTAITERLPPADVRPEMIGLVRGLRAAGATTLLLSETPPREHRYSRSGVEEFVADGVLFLGEMERQHDAVRTLQVAKMRGAEHSHARFLMDLSESGISLAPLLRSVPASGPAPS